MSEPLENTHPVELHEADTAEETPTLEYIDDESRSDIRPRPGGAPAGDGDGE